MTNGFKTLAQDRQKALHEGDTEGSPYRDVHTTAKYYQSPKIAAGSIILPVQSRQIVESNSRQWWKTINTVIGLQPSKSQLCDLVDQLCGGDARAVANNINMVFKEVTSDLQSLLPAAAPADHDVPDEFIISVTDCEQPKSQPKYWVLEYTYALLQN